MTDRVKGILFDLGDTLLDFGDVNVRVMFESGAKLAYEYMKELNRPLPPFGRYHSRQLWAIRWNYLKSRITRREFNALDLIGRFSRSMGHALTAEQMRQVAWRWYEPLSRCATVEDGSAALLAEFRDAGLTLGLVSNTFVPGEVLDRHLRREGLLDLLPVRVYSCDVLYRKPDPRIFQLALQRSGLVASETVFVGDSLLADVQGARRAGMISVLKDPHGRHDGSSVRPDHRVRRLAELRQIVGGYNAPA